MTPKLTYPVTDVHQVLRACNAAEPLKPGDPRWYNFTELEFSDFFLLAATSAERTLAELGAPLPGEAVKPIVEWFAEVTQEDQKLRKSELGIEAEAQLGGKLPLGLGKLAAKFSSGIKAGASHAKTVRQQMRNYPDRLIDCTNALLEVAHQRLNGLEPARDRGLIFLFDNLDRYDPEQIDQVLMVGSTLLRKLRCHTLYTIPIDLEYNPRSGPLRDAYGPAVVLPMIPLRRPDQRWGPTVAESPHEEAALQGMWDALSQRLDLTRIFEHPEDVDALIRMSGGCVRDLMHLVSLAYEMSDGEVLSSDGVATAVQELRATHRRELSQADYERLAEIAARHSVPRDEQTHRLLYNRWALEYYDKRGEVWLDVHPLVIEIDEFQDAYRRKRAVSA